MKIKIATAALILIAISSPARADDSSGMAPTYWQVSEGASGSTRGTWTLTVANGAVSGQAQMTTITNQPLGYRVTGTVQGQNYALQGKSPSSGNTCNYVGQISGDGAKILGSSTCGSGTFPWVAVLSPNFNASLGSN